MALTDNERTQEIFLMVGDKISTVSRKWWYLLLAVIVLSVPGYYIAKYSFTKTMMAVYHPPKIIYTSVQKEPLQVVEKKIFVFSGNSYGGYVKVKNINLEWGVPKQDYTAVFKTIGGTEVTRVTGVTFVLPSSEKLIVFSRFTAETKPEEIQFTLGNSSFIHKPPVDVSVSVERVSLQNPAIGTVASAGVKNLTPFTIKQINLPIALYNNQSQVVGVNFTYVNNVDSGETRTFQYVWPVNVAGAVRAEIIPEVNVFEKDLFTAQEGVSPF